jgi:hypothetical protein
VSCNKTAEQAILLKARVADTSDVNCSLPVLDFSEDSAVVRTLTKNNSLAYLAINLPQSLRVQNQLIFIEIDASQPTGYIACRTLGPSIPPINIKFVIAR